MKKIKNLINKTKKYLKYYVNRYFIFYFKSSSNLINRINNEKIIFFLLTPTYGNIGDQAIELATDKFLNNYFPEYRIIKVHLEDIYSRMKSIKKIVSPDDIVIIQGGGNFGDYYIEVEFARRFVVDKISNTPIFTMPSSMGYLSKLELSKSIKTYSRRRNFIIVSRDYYSYNYSKEHFKNNIVKLVPDIVLSVDLPESKMIRDQISICMRTDDEQFEKDNRSKVKSYLQKKFSNQNLFIFDTQVARGIPDELKLLELDSMLSNFKRSKFVITDRLHGVIFSCITKTPCVILRSKDKKIIGIYDWLKEIPYLKMIDNFDELDDAVSLIRDIKIFESDSIDLSKYYCNFAKFIKDKTYER